MGLYLEARERRPTPTPPMPSRPVDPPSANDLVVQGRVDRTDGPALCERARRLLEGTHTDLVVCDVSALIDPDLGTIDALARLQLACARLGSGVRLRHASVDLQQLLAMAGLGDVVPCCPGSAVEARRQSEDGEQPRRVEEERDAADPIP